MLWKIVRCAAKGYKAICGFMNYFRISVFMCYIQFEFSCNHDHHVTESEYINGDRVASALSQLWGDRPSCAWRPAQLPEPTRRRLQSPRRVGSRVAGYVTSARSFVVPADGWSCATNARHLPRRRPPATHPDTWRFRPMRWVQVDPASSLLFPLLRAPQLRLEAQFKKTPTAPRCMRRCCCVRPL
jgi:hypothetical protein